MSDPNAHDPHNLPLIVFGGKQLRGGRHLRTSGTPLTNLYMTVLANLGVPVQRIGDSTGQLSLLSDV
jgi:hypothetical protein